MQRYDEHFTFSKFFRKNFSKKCIFSIFLIPRFTDSQIHTSVYLGKILSFPKISRQFFDYFPKLVDTFPKKVDIHPKLVDSVD